MRYLRHTNSANGAKIIVNDIKRYDRNASNTGRPEGVSIVQLKNANKKSTDIRKPHRSDDDLAKRIDKFCDCLSFLVLNTIRSNNDLCPNINTLHELPVVDRLNQLLQMRK